MKTQTSKKKIKMIFFDMDGVLFHIEGYNENGQSVAISTWNVLFDHLGIYNEHERLKKMFINGQLLSYMEWTNEACRVLQKHNLTKDKFMEVINNRSLMKGAKETLEKLKKRGYKTAVITGSFKILAERARNLLDLDEAIAHCDLIFDQLGNLKKWRLRPCDFTGKIEYFKGLIRKFGFKPSESAFIGDNVNDIPIFKEVGLSIAFNCQKEEVKKAAQVVIDKKDLREILKYFPPIKN